MSVSEHELNEYLETAIWSSTDESDESGGEPLDRNFSTDDFTDEAREEARAELEAFENDMDRAVDALGDDYEGSTEGWPHDFWLNRNGHGAGFWDRPERYGEELAEALDVLSKRYGEKHVIIVEITPRDVDVAGEGEPEYALEFM